MPTVSPEQKIQRIETELAVLKRQVAGTPNFDVDEKIWNEMKPTVKRIRRERFQRKYGSK